MSEIERLFLLAERVAPGAELKLTGNGSRFFVSVESSGLEVYGDGSSIDIACLSAFDGVSRVVQERLATAVSLADELRRLAEAPE